MAHPGRAPGMRALLGCPVAPPAFPGATTLMEGRRRNTRLFKYSPHHYPRSLAIWGHAERARPATRAAGRLPAPRTPAGGEWQLHIAAQQRDPRSDAVKAPAGGARHAAPRRRTMDHHPAGGGLRALLAAPTYLASAAGRALLGELGLAPPPPPPPPPPPLGPPPRPCDAGERVFEPLRGSRGRVWDRAYRQRGHLRPISRHGLSPIPRTHLLPSASTAADELEERRQEWARQRHAAQQAQEGAPAPPARAAGRLARGGGGCEPPSAAGKRGAAPGYRAARQGGPAKDAPQRAQPSTGSGAAERSPDGARGAAAAVIGRGPDGAGAAAAGAPGGRPKDQRWAGPAAGARRDDGAAARSPLRDDRWEAVQLLLHTPAGASPPREERWEAAQLAARAAALAEANRQLEAENQRYALGGGGGGGGPRGRWDADKELELGAGR
jgi:hypothetical protein